jgi:hypothetical protein
LFVCFAFWGGGGLFPFLFLVSNDLFILFIRQERKDVLADREGGPEGELCFADMHRLDYTKCVVFEALRLFPTLSRIMRKAEVSGKLGTYNIPKNSVMRYVFECAVMCCGAD